MAEEKPLAELKGWVYRIRDIGKIKFILLRDGKNIYQLVLKKGETPEEVLKLVEDLKPESAIIAKGEWKEGKGGKKELHVKELEILAKAEPLPIDPEKASPKTRFDWRVIDLKLPQRQTIFWLRTKVLKHFRDFFLKEGFVEINTPKIVNIGAESGAEVFPVMYFGREAYLAQSPQLYKQMLVSVFPKVFEIAFAYRAEPSRTSRHLAEFTSVDAEMAFIKSHHDVLDFIEKLLKYVTEKAMEEEEFEKLGLEPFDVKFERITFEEGKEIVKGDVEDDFSTEEEKKLGEFFMEQGIPFVEIIDYPWKVRPFYSMRYDDNPQKTKTFDVLFKGLEIISGAQREHRYEQLVKNVKEKGIDPERLKVYLETFKYGMPPHGGFGLGLERYLRQLLNLDDVREVIYFYRDIDRLLP